MTTAGAGQIVAFLVAVARADHHDDGVTDYHGLLETTNATKQREEEYPP
jgi:hypothetical protein